VLAACAAFAFAAQNANAQSLKDQQTCAKQGFSTTIVGGYRFNALEHGKRANGFSKKEAASKGGHGKFAHRNDYASSSINARSMWDICSTFGGENDIMTPS
jgi:hypothetical protein